MAPTCCRRAGQSATSKETVDHPPIQGRSSSNMASISSFGDLNSGFQARRDFSNLQAKMATHKAAKFRRPMQEGCLFQAEYDHLASDTCVGCDRSNLAPNLHESTNLTRNDIMHSSVGPKKRIGNFCFRYLLSLPSVVLLPFVPPERTCDLACCSQKLANSEERG
jgi:hypothetical protein